VNVAEWTFDPLVRRNAYFNLSKLGAQARDYLVDFYGVMTDGINAGDESDRLLISWRLDSTEAEAAASGNAENLEVEQLIAKGATPVLSVGNDGRPQPHTSSASILLCQVPSDIVEVRRSDPKLAHLWRISVRGAMTHAFDAGHRVTGFTRSGWYVLER
jgi:predicted GNAT superfamily acetyltransferase